MGILPLTGVWNVSIKILQTRVILDYDYEYCRWKGYDSWNMKLAAIGYDCEYYLCKEYEMVPKYSNLGLWWNLTTIGYGYGY